MSKTVKVYVTQQDMWLIEALEEIVKAKRAMGLKSSISFELLRLAKNGLTDGLAGSKMDRAILEKTDDAADLPD